MLTAHNKYSRCNVNNFGQQVQTPLSQIKRLFVDFLLHFWKSCNLEHFERKDENPNLIISEIMEWERGGYLNV